MFPGNYCFSYFNINYFTFYVEKRESGWLENEAERNKVMLRREKVVG